MAAPQEPGFELTIPGESSATFFPWAIGMSSAKDMMIIDRLTRMPLDEFAEAFEDPTQRGRGPIMLTMIALSIKSKYPDWSVERILAVVDQVELPEIAYIDAAEEDDEPTPLPESEPGSDAQSFGSPSGDSSSSAPPTNSTTSRPSGHLVETRE